VERQWIGGSCPNTNCLPSKNEIWSAKVADLVRRAAAFGTVTSPGPVEMARVRQRRRGMVDGLIAMHLDHYRASGAELIMGAGSFVAPKTLEVRVATLSDSAVLRARTIAEPQGFMKALVEAQSDRFLGFTMLGPEAGEVMAVLIKELWAFQGNPIAVRFAYEWHDDAGHWYRSFGNENWEFDEHGLMTVRHACINDLPIREGDRKFHWPLGRRPDGHPGLAELGF
jgi:pyruvate/2-oxoglutarate dehydrogenase complex dihydrolipoamide dehydrogenase (E3) component